MSLEDDGGAEPSLAAPSNSNNTSGGAHGLRGRRQNDAATQTVDFDMDIAAARKAVSTSVPPRVRSKRKRVALALNDWNQIPGYLKDNE